MRRVDDLWLIDTTLRDGEQAPGVVFSPEEKVRIASMLDDVGVDEIEAGTAIMGTTERETIREIVARKLRARISVWCRACREDIEAAMETAAQGVHIAFPVSEIQLAAMGKSRKWIEQTLPDMIHFARQHFTFVSVGAQDAGRCEDLYMKTFAQFAYSLGVERLRIADTVGSLTPLVTQRLIASIKERFPQLRVDFHAHNDLGMATANAVTAWQTGAEAVSVTVNGIGERAGNAALEEVLMAVYPSLTTTRYNTANLAPLCEYVARVAHRPIPVGKPVCGQYVYTHESGIHAKGSLSGATVFQAFDGHQVGRESSCNVFGKHSGRSALTALLESRGIKLDAVTLARLLTQIKVVADREKRCLSGEEVLDLYRASAI
ncbi:MAG: homocitrate synthase [Tannerellaceae bacterium]|nr:homocitrate synthase [Tannerellaceae bacterium]